MLSELQHHVNAYMIEKFLHLKTAYNESNEISMKMNEYDSHSQAEQIQKLNDCHDYS